MRPASSFCVAGCSSCIRLRASAHFGTRAAVSIAQTSFPSSPWISSTSILSGFLGDLQAAGVDLYLDRQGIDTTTPGGKALFQMMGVFAEFERAMIRERINAGLTRAKKEGRRLGRPPGASKKRQAKQGQVQKLHKQGHSIRQIARQVGIATGTVQTYLKPA